MSTLGKRIKQVRGDLSQTEFSQTNGITQVTLSRYERDERVPDADFIVHLCKSFNILTEWLLFGRGPMRHEEEAASPQKRESAPTPVALCAHCLALEQKMVKKLESFEEERREMTTEYRQVMAENRKLWEKNAALREENATLRERQYQRSGHGDSEPVGHAG